jgi:hypothetical protein
MRRRQFQRHQKAERQRLLRSAVRKHLSADALIKTVKSCFEAVNDPRPGKPEIPLADALMSGFAMFSLKDPSVLAFEKRWKEEDSNLKSIYKLTKIPSDTQMRTILDPVQPEELRAPYNAILRDLQRGKVLEQLRYLDEGYLISIDGTGYFSSEKLYSPLCLQKISSKTGRVTYQLQTLGAAVVHPELKEVIPLIPEIISRQDGDNKNDCELNASRRFLSKFRKEHPHVEIVVTQDGISPNGPYVRFLKALDCHFILTVKETNHARLFAQFAAAVEAKQARELFVQDPKDQGKFHSFRWVNGLALNASHKDLLVNVLEYWQVTGEMGEITKRFCWVTDIPLLEDNVYRIMRAGRARWKIENETFNTLKNQGYNFEHNYGLGRKYLSMVFVKLMMLAFLVDQVQQLSCGLFRAVWKKLGSKKELWERMRSLFRCFKLDSMEMLYLALLHGFARNEPVICFDSS